MKLTRLILVCTLLLLAASPVFAAPPCSYCDFDFATCQFDGAGPGERCRYLSGGCQTYFGYCISYTQPDVLAEWDVASIEISRPTLDSITVTAPAEVAEVRTPQATEQR